MSYRWLTAHIELFYNWPQTTKSIFLTATGRAMALATLPRFRQIISLIYTQHWDYFYWILTKFQFMKPTCMGCFNPVAKSQGYAWVQFKNKPPLLSADLAAIHTCISSCLDLHDSLYSCLTHKSLSCQQLVQNAAARDRPDAKQRAHFGPNVAVLTAAAQIELVTVALEAAGAV